MSTPTPGADRPGDVLVRVRDAGAVDYAVGEARLRGAGLRFAAGLSAVRAVLVPAAARGGTGVALVVVRRRGRTSSPFPLTVPSLAGLVAARSRVPAVVLPPAWNEVDHASEPVVVGVQDAVSSGEVVRYALTEARRLHTGVRLVRGWFFSPVFDEALSAPGCGPAEAACVREEVRRSFADLTALFGDVPCEVVAAHGSADSVLTAQSYGARRLVVGRHDPVPPFGSRLGPVNRSLLARSACPLVVVPELGVSGATWLGMPPGKENWRNRTRRPRRSWLMCG